MHTLLTNLTQFPATTLPLEHWINAFTTWLTVHTAAETGFLSKYIGDALNWWEQRLEQLPWPIVVVIIGAVAWRVGRWALALGVAAALVCMGLLGLWTQGMDTLALVIVATGVCVLVGIPLGILMARSAGVNRVITPLLDLMQTMPSFVYLIPALLFFGLGAFPAVLATLVYAIPPVVRLTDLGIREVAREMVEAGQSSGATPRQILTKIQIPLAMPTILAGVNQTIMMALAMVVIASMVGAQGLGLMVLTGISQLNVGQGLFGGVGIVLLAIIMDRITRRLVRTRTVSAV